MGPTQALDGDDLPVCQSRGHLTDRVPARLACLFDVEEPGTAGWAGDGLGVVAPVQGIGIFTSAIRAHRKLPERGARAVVG